MWEYNIIKGDLGYSIRKKKDRIIYYLSKNKKRVTNKENAIVFFDLDEAKGSLVVMRIVDAKEKL